MSLPLYVEPSPQTSTSSSSIARTSSVPIAARPSGVVLKYARPPERMWNAPHASAAKPSSTSAARQSTARPPVRLVPGLRREEVPDTRVLDVVQPLRILRVVGRQSVAEVADVLRRDVLVQLGAVRQDRHRIEPLDVPVRALRPRQRPLR